MSSVALGEPGWGQAAPPVEVAPAAEPTTQSPPATSAPAPAAETPSPTDAYTLFRQAFDASQYEAAVPYAKQVLQFAEAQAKTPVDEEVQVALMNLATTQYLMRDYTAAEESYARAIGAIEASGRPLHARLARAYAGLAASYHDGKRYDLAVKNFDKAVSLTRRHEGLLTEQQVPLLEKYIDSLTELGRYQDALQAHRYLLRIATRQHGETSPALAPALERLGRWYVEVGLYDQARRALRRAIDLVETGEGDDSPRLIGPLTALGSCNRRQLIDPNQTLFEGLGPERAASSHDPGMMAGSPAVSPQTLTAEAERSFERAAAIAQQRKDPSPAQVADVLTQLGDWYQSRALPDRARPNYLKAWAAASRVTQKIDGKPLAEALFGQPVLLQIVRAEGWNRYSSRPSDQVEVRNVVLEFTVSAEGNAEAVKVTDDSGDQKRAERTADSLRTARYRPRLEQGQPVATAGVSLTQPWILPLPTPGEAAPDKGGAAPRDKDRSSAPAGVAAPLDASKRDSSG
jgi:tetratricopeptide (TPR) repeat protein